MEAPDITSASQHEFEGRSIAIAAIEHAVFLGQARPAFGSLAVFGWRRAYAHTLYFNVSIEKRPGFC